jgi:hypothetical protein
VTTSILIPFAVAFVAHVQKRKGISVQKELEFYEARGRVPAPVGDHVLP